MNQRPDTSSSPDQATSLEALRLSVRAYNALCRAGIHTVEQVVPLTDAELLDVRNVGPNTLEDIKEKLAGYLDEHPSLRKLRAQEEPEPQRVSAVDGPSIDVLGLPTRVRNALKRADVDTVGQLASLSKEEVLSIYSVGEKGAREIEQKLGDYLEEHPDVLVEEERPEPPAPPLIAPERLERLSDIPLDAISVDRLVFPPPEAGYIARHGITSVEELARQPIDTFPEDSLFVDRLESYLAWLVEQDDETWKIEVSRGRVSPIHYMILAETTLDAVIETWFETLTPREREILRRRLGCDGPEMTLAEIGEQMGLTRERIRQLESRALQELSSHQMGEPVDSLLQCLLQAFADAGGLMTETEVQENLAEFTAVEAIDIAWAARLLLTSSDAFQETAIDGLWGLSSHPLALVPQVNQALLDVLKDIGESVPEDQLVARLAEASLAQQHAAICGDAFIQACLRTHPRIECVEGLFRVRKRRRRKPPRTEMGQASQEEAKPTASKPSKSRPELVIDLESVKPLDKPPATLDEWEQHLRSQVSQVELLGEITLTDQERAQLGKLIGLRVRTLGHSQALRTLRSEYPCALAVYLAAQGVYGYEGGDYWSEVVEVTGFDSSYTWKVGRVFEDILQALDLPLFFDMRAEAHRYVSLILAHGGIPNYCLPDFFDNMLQPSVVRAEYADMSTAELIDQWLWRPSIVQFTDKPVIRFLKYGGRVAEDFVERCREMAWTYVDTGVLPSPEEVGLPQRVVAAYDEWIVEQGADQVMQDKGERWRLRKPQVLVDPWGEGVFIQLPPQQVPATEIYADIEWQVAVDEEKDQVPVHVRRRGFDRKTEAEVFPITRPAEIIEVSLVVDGASKRTWRFPGVDEEHPLLVFDPERGRLISWTLSLPAGPLSFLYPADWQLQFEGSGRLIEALPRLPWGWSTFRGETWDLTHAKSLILLKEGEEDHRIPLRPDETARQSCLEGGQQLSSEGSEESAPVYVGAPPRVRVPLSGRQAIDEELTRWRLRVRNKWTAVPEVDVTVPLTDLKSELSLSDQHVELPLSLPSLLGYTPYGNFEIRLRGPLGRDAAFTLRMIRHFVLCGHEELHLPMVQEGPQQATLLAETRPEDHIECVGEDVECQVRVTEHGEVAWQHEIEVGPNVTDLELTVVHPHPSGEDVRVPIRVPIRRLRWALVDEGTKARRSVWTGRTIKRPIDAVLQHHSPFLFVRLPLRETGNVQIELRLLDLEGAERQATDRVSLSHSRQLHRFHLGAFLDTIRASQSPVLRFELIIYSLPGWDRPFRFPILSLTQTLLVEDVQLSFRTSEGRVFFDLTWQEDAPLRNRRVRFWPLWRPWDPVFEQEIPDDAEGALSFEVNPEKLRSGKYRLEFLVVDPWASASEVPQRPPRGAPSTADVEMIAADRQLEILNDRIRRQGPGFDILLERTAIYQDIGAAEKAASDRQWCYEHLDDGTNRQALALVDLAREAGDEALTQALQLKLFAARRIKRLLMRHEAGDVPTDLFEAYLANLPRSGMLPLETCRQLLAVEDETVRLHAVQQLIHRRNSLGPETVVRWVEKAEISDADAVALLMINPQFSAEVLKKSLGRPVATRLLEKLAPELGDRTPIVQVGTWVYTDAGWGRIDHIEDQTGAPVQQYLSGQTDYRLHVTLRPAVDAEPVTVDLKRKLITFTDADIIFTCSKCNGFSAQDCYLIVERHDRVAHSGIGPSYQKEKITKRSLRNLSYRARPPLRRGLGIPESSEYQRSSSLEERK